jgi:hypothetical protein
VVIYEADNRDLTYYLELGHLTTSEKTRPFAQFLPVSHEEKCNIKVKDKLTNIYRLGMGLEPLHEII